MLSLGDLFLTEAQPPAPHSGNTAPPSVAGGSEKRPAPFSIRLTKSDRARLALEAAGAPLGAYIKAKILGAPPVRTYRTTLTVQDQASLAQLVTVLGRAKLFQNLSELADLARSGSLLIDETTTRQIESALADVAEMRRLLMSALGLKATERAS
ncbi:hypothetical protein [Aureimonas sp. ME7]|uniref:hypothetical protein n=1 Tax=Aureimonas sp. ME7 TaxID=2744252 RepID=UPI0015F4D1D8|nr:hypothetical protein [Aureimonas sp. ME7]